jgi:hypothetical protein
VYGAVPGRSLERGDAAEQSFTSVIWCNLYVWFGQEFGGVGNLSDKMGLVMSEAALPVWVREVPQCFEVKWFRQTLRVLEL